MAKFYDALNDEVMAFIKQQKIFFTATSANEGLINLSPKGMDTFRVLDKNTLCFLNLTGSANETSAHLLKDGRITIMFCGFKKQPLILRLYGKGESVHPRDEAWQTYVKLFPDLPGKRQCIVVTVTKVQTSCGYSVPFYDYKGERHQLSEWSKKKGEKGIQAYWKANNQESIDGFPTGIF